MRFLRLRLRHFRGVDQAEVSFRPTGVTVIAGPNEIGKSSLAEAVDLLFDYLDSSSAQAVRAVQPVDRDEGSEVELEFEAGPYRATYLKSFNRAKRTELTVHAPRPESLTGRTAHERVEEILGETVDLGLWKALRIQQETPLSYPDLDGHRSLAAALDRAAGQARSGDAEASLYEAARTEYEIYHTPGGQPRAPLRDAAAAVERAAAAVAELETAMRSVERDVEASVRLDRQIAEGEAQLLPLRRTAAVREEDLARLEKQEPRAGRAGEPACGRGERPPGGGPPAGESPGDGCAGGEGPHLATGAGGGHHRPCPGDLRKREQEARTRAALEAAGSRRGRRWRTRSWPSGTSHSVAESWTTTSCLSGWSGYAMLSRGPRKRRRFWRATRLPPSCWKRCGQDTWRSRGRARPPRRGAPASWSRRSMS
jgi:hypothetical protein